MASGLLYIKEAKGYRRVFKEGKKVFSPHFVLYNAAGAVGGSRLGISVAKASIPLATRRNRTKRRIKEFWRLKKERPSSARDFVIVVKRGTDKLTNEAFYKELTNIFDKNLP
ncbi:MAG: ribonuclease P protein component [Candidatus Omnitrophica bacterium]|nr:ribonuclease P protein component [Candidatus Omnitrophota bacterium]